MCNKNIKGIGGGYWSLNKNYPSASNWRWGA